MVLNGPVRGSALVRTAFSPDGTRGRGTINNCANGITPWGTNLTCEENWAGYFRRPAATDNPRRSAKEVAGLARYGVNSATGNYGWASVTPAVGSNTSFRRWDATVDPAAAGPAGDFRNEPNQFGWVVEVDPYDAVSRPRKRTALGRMAHEGAWPGLFVPGRRPAWYMGDDSRGEYLYKFVSATPWVAADAQFADRLAIGDKYLDSGTLYVARFNEDGSGTWLPLVFGQGTLGTGTAAFTFADQVDVLVHSRIAADIVGATAMDRPEWTAVNPRTGEVYLTLTNNSNRSPVGTTPQTRTNASNPRAYSDPKRRSGDQVNQDPVSPPERTNGNANGHIIRLREAGDNTEALSFSWDIYLFGAGEDLDRANINLSGLEANNDFSSPDGLWFSRPTNASGQINPVLWIQTDDGAYTDVTNCMMLAAMPGQTGDGGARTVTNTVTPATGSPVSNMQATIVGKAATGATLRRFLVGPVECEVTGIDSTPDGRSLFVNIQHPGEDARAADQPTSNWPASQTGPAPGVRPRSATIVITKNDGGVVGL
jgi:secreted PhoX family phosphatase